MQVPRGFRLAGVHCGIKEEPSAEDLTLIVADQPAVAAGVYTENIIFAAPVALDRQRTPSGSIRAVVVNSGNANACTGERGMNDCQTMLDETADAVGATEQQVLVMSTGIIGQYLPMEKIKSGIRHAVQQLGDQDDHLHAAARGFLTSDKGTKMVHRNLALPSGDHITLTGIAKGAGMIGPNMATMLALIMTDARLTASDAEQSLRRAVSGSFNCISVEGHMSTNDTVLLLASGAQQEEPLTNANLLDFQAELARLCVDLAKMIPDDGEGASHLMCVHVTGCQSSEDARLIAKTVAASNLVKTAICGNDPNWGRIVSAAGYAQVPFDPSRFRLAINGHTVYEHGTPTEFDPTAVSQSMASQREVSIELAVGNGNGTARFWSSDLTTEYVRFNADYHT